jgi:4-hydroxythreonine-4-phosphate dehydrogenase
VIVGSRELLAERARMLGLDVELSPYLPDEADKTRRGRLTVLDVPLAAPCVAGRLDPANARHVLNLLDRATDGAANGEFAAVVTAPVQKSVINDAGVPFTGHTEYLEERVIDPSVSVRAAVVASPIHEAARPGTYAPAR